jgi:multiple sugar transport system substrate-binding protein
MADLAAADVLEDLSPVWNKYIEAEDVNPSLAEPYTFDGKILGVPTANSYYVGFYNKTVFAEQGLEPPTTWDELMAVAQGLKDAEITPFGVTVQDKWPSFIWFQQILIGSDPQLYQDLMAGKVQYTDERVLEAMNVWKGMIDQGYFSDPTIPGVATTGQSQLAVLFREGRIGMILWGDWYIPYLTADDFKSGSEFGVFAFPKLNPDAPNALIFETGPFGLAKNSSQKEAALEFIDWWMTPEAQTEWLKLYPGIPTNLRVTPEDPLLQEEMTFISEGEYQLLTRFWEATPTDIVLQAVDQLSRFMLEPDALEDVLSTIQQTADTYWADHPVEEG